MSTRQPLLPLAGEAGPRVGEGRVRGDSASSSSAQPSGDARHPPSAGHPVPLRGRGPLAGSAPLRGASFSLERKKEEAAGSPAVDDLDWGRIEADLDAYGCAAAGRLLSSEACASLAGLYEEEAPFRSRIVMARHGFGRGEYKYFAYPLPEPIARLRAPLYARLAPIANRWHAAMGLEARFPETHEDFLARCHAAGQARPTPLLLRYRAGDYNCLHQDLYGDHVFPLQVAILLSEPGRDFSGGRFVLTEQRPRMQSRAEVVDLGQGEAVMFAVNARPVQGTRGPYRVTMRHGVSRLTAGERFTAGIIFHDAT